RNLAVDALRLRRATPVDPADLTTLLGRMTGTPAEPGPEQRTLAGESAAELRASLAALPVEQARAIVLAGIYGLTAREIAEREHIPLGTAKTRIRAAMIKLRGALVGGELS
ncbi:MAG: hypothetical protein J2O49_07765, partial [Sciscionella sp.]|nr:hypothetical protein [Sciscionella sp.]